MRVISRGVYDVMDREFEEEGNSVSSSIRKSKLKLFSCERDQVVATSGECDVKLKHHDFQCITPVIVAKGLANECLIGMNVLVRWPAMKEAIRVLLNRQPENERDSISWSKNPQIARLNNICLPRFMANSELKSKLFSRPTTTKVLETEARTVGCPTSEAKRILNTCQIVLNNEEPKELAEEVGEENFRAKYMPEDRGTDMAINLISMQPDSREKVHTMEEVGKALDYVESMIKGVFPTIVE